LAALRPAPLAYASVPVEPLRPRGEPFYGALIGDVQLFGVTPDLTGQGLDTIFTPGAEGELEAALGARAVPAPIPDGAPVTTARPLSGICSLPVDNTGRTGAAVAAGSCPAAQFLYGRTGWTCQPVYACGLR
jgi:hypothetical protein